MLKAFVHYIIFYKVSVVFVAFNSSGKYILYFNSTFYNYVIIGSRTGSHVLDEFV